MSPILLSLSLLLSVMARSVFCGMIANVSVRLVASREHSVVDAVPLARLRRDLVPLVR
jgi:hypothetical protein